jgi:hypothetical protein
VTVLLCDCAIQPTMELFHPGFTWATELYINPASNPDVNYGRIAGTRNEWQNEKWVAKKKSSFPYIGYTHPTCWVRNFIHNLYLVDINLLFPRKSCSIGYRYPLESIHSVRKLNIVIFAHCPLVSANSHNGSMWAFYWFRLFAEVSTRVFFANHFSKIGNRTRALVSK